MYLEASTETTGVGGNMSEKLWWVVFGLFVLACVLAIFIKEPILTAVAILIAIVLAVDLYREYRSSR